jgi:hypothetical protein
MGDYMKKLIPILILTANICYGSELKESIKAFGAMSADLSPSVTCASPLKFVCGVSSGFNYEKKISLTPSNFTLLLTKTEASQSVKNFVARKAKVSNISKLILTKLYLTSTNAEQIKCGPSEGLVGSCESRAQSMHVSMDALYEAGGSRGMYQYDSSEGKVVGLKVASKKINEPPYDLQVATTILINVDGDVLNFSNIQKFNSAKNCH